MVEVIVSADFFLDSRIAAAEAKSKQASLEEDAIIDAVQSECKHEGFIAEAPYKESTWCSDASAPFRVCLRCGILEDGWGCGYKILRAKPGMKVTRDEGYQARRFGTRKFIYGSTT